MADVDEKYDQAVTWLIEHDQARLAEVTDGQFQTEHPLFDFDGELPLEKGVKIPAFSREGVERQFLQLLGRQELKVLDRRSLAQQSDFLAALEKTFRMRHQTRVQLLARGVARAFGHTRETGFKRFALKRLPQLEQ
jgi:hypothetical protein